MRGIARADRFDVLGPALLRHLQAMAQRGREHRQAIGHHFGQHRGALTAARHQHAEQRILGEIGERATAQFEHFLAHRVADAAHFAPQLGIEPVDRVVSGADHVHPLGQQPVDPAQRRVLFVDHRRDFGRARRQQRRERRITAEAHDCARLEAFKQPQRHPPPLPDRGQALCHRQRIASQAARRQHMRGQRFGLAGNFGTARIGDQRHVMPARFKLDRQRESRDQVPAGAPGRQHEMA